MKELWPVVASVLGVFLVMGSGAWCRRRGWLTPEADRSLANLTANLLLPAYLIDKILTGDSYGTLSETWAPPLFGFVMTGIGFLSAYSLARFVGPWFGLDTEGKQRAFGLCAGVANYGYIPLPLAERFYRESLVDLILHNVGVELALWSIGIAIISGKSGGWKSALVSPPLISVVASILLRHFALGDRIPSPIMTAVPSVGACAIPIGLLLSGAIIVDFLRGARWWDSPRVLVLSVLLRQGLLPMLMLSAASFWVTAIDFRQVVMLQAAMPAAVFPIVLVRLYGRDTETALRVVLSTSVAGILMIPFWLALGGWWLGLSTG